MTRDEKREMVSGLNDLFSKASVAIVTRISNITVEEISSVRRDIRNNKCEFKVVKNTFARRALEETPLEKLKDDFKGSTAISIGYDEPTVPAKLLKKHVKELDGKLTIVCGIVEGSYLNSSEILAFADLPGKEELLTGLVLRLQSPIAGFNNSISGILKKLVYALNAVKEEKS